jgi:uncharacterized membrane protein YgaE (UPF0421/DUF939 family)
MPERSRILTAVYKFTLAVIAIAIAGVLGGLVGTVVGALVATVVGLVWPSSDERAAERRATKLEEQVREISTESPRLHTARMERYTSVIGRGRID